jgi:hypothetical protein
MLKKIWRAETGIFLGIWLVLMIGGRSRLFRDLGTFWHVVVGQAILSSGRLIYTDPFSFPFHGKPWIDSYWLSECALALIQRIDGLDSLLLATATALACLYTWVAHRLIRAGIHWLLAVLITALAMAASSYHFHPRPHLVTILLLGWSFARLCDFEAGRIPFRGLLWLVPLFVIWTNTHGGMVGGFGTLILTVAGWSCAGLVHKAPPILRSRQIIALGGLIIACGLTAYVNPFGAELPRTWLSLLGSPVLPRLMDEHLPLLSVPERRMVLPFGLLYVVALIGVLPAWPRVTWWIPLVWLALAFTRIRHGPLFAITAAIALGEMFPHVRWAAWLSRLGSELFHLRGPDPTASRKRLDGRPALLPTALVLIAVALQVTAHPVPVLGHGWAKLDRSLWPVELLPELRDYERNRPDGTPIFNEMVFGGFLIDYTPGLRVFIDDRCELYGNEWLLTYVHALQHDPAQVERWSRCRRSWPTVASAP